MKTFMIAMSAFSLLPKNASAQIPKGHGESSYKMFYTILDRLSKMDYQKQKSSFTGQLNSAETQLKKVKRSDPNFDTSQLEKNIQPYRYMVNAKCYVGYHNDREMLCKNAK